MTGDEKAKAAQEAEADIQAQGPGMGAALLAVLVIILTTGIVAMLIYVIMVTIVPSEPRQVGKAAEIDQPFYPAHNPRRIPN